MDCLSERWKCPLSRSEGECLLGCTVLGQEKVVLARPETPMNLSGRVGRKLGDVFGLIPEEILVVCDDVDLPLGRLRLRGSGGSGGHRGLMSVAEALCTDAFPRLRIGVGRPPEGVETAEYVLDVFEPEEERIVARVVPRAADAVEAALRGSLEAAMSEFNGWFPEGEGSRESGSGGC